MNELSAAVTPGPGHNLPAPYDLLAQETENIVAEANRALNAVKEIADEETAKKFDGFEHKISAAFKAVDAQRKTEKDPHDEAAKAIQVKYKPLLDRLETAKKLCKTLLTRWLIKKEDRRRADAKRAEEEALSAMREAEEAAARAKSATGDIVGAAVAAQETTAKAEEAVKAADQIANARTQVKSDYSDRARSLRTTWKGRILDQDAVYRSYRTDPAVLETLQCLVNQSIRTGGRDDQDKPMFQIPGVELIAEQSVT